MEIYKHVKNMQVGNLVVVKYENGDTDLTTVAAISCRTDQREKVSIESPPEYEDMKIIDIVPARLNTSVVDLMGFATRNGAHGEERFIILTTTTELVIRQLLDTSLRWLVLIKQRSGKTENYIVLGQYQYCYVVQNIVSVVTGNKMKINTLKAEV